MLALKPGMLWVEIGLCKTVQWSAVALHDQRKLLALVILTEVYRYTFKKTPSIFLPNTSGLHMHRNTSVTCAGIMQAPCELTLKAKKKSKDLFSTWIICLFFHKIYRYILRKVSHHPRPSTPGRRSQPFYLYGNRKTHPSLSEEVS